MLRMRNRIQCGRILRNRCDDGALGECQVAHFLIKVSSRCYLDTEGIGTEVDGIQILRDDTFLDFFLAESRPVLDFEGQILLLELPDIALELSLMQTTAKDVILDQLLSNRRAAARGVIIRYHAAHRTEDRLQVDTVVLPEALVLDGNEGVDEVLRELVVAHALTVRACGHQRCGDVSIGVQHLRCIGSRTDMDRIDVRCGVENAPEHAEAHRGAQEAEAEHEDQQRHLDDMGDAVPELDLRVVHLI